MDNPYVNMPDELYFDGTHYGIHSLMDFTKYGPRGFYERHIECSVHHYSNAAYNPGTAAHELILRGEHALKMRVTSRPSTYENDKGEVKKWNANAKVCKEWMKENEDKIILKDEEFTACYKMRDAVMEHPKAAKYFESGQPEVGCRTTVSCCPVQIKIDWLTDTTIVDLKTTQSIEDFKRNVYKYGYWRQAAHYIRVYKLVTGKQLPFIFVVVEKDSPHRCELFELDDEYLAEADWLNLDTYAQVGHYLMENGLRAPWPKHLNQSELIIQTINKPSWLSVDVD